MIQQRHTHRTQCLERTFCPPRLIGELVASKVVSRVFREAVITHFKLHETSPQDAVDPFVVSMNVFMLPEPWDAFTDDPYEVDIWPQTPVLPPFSIRPPKGRKKASIRLFLQVKDLKEEAVTSDLRSEAQGIWENLAQTNKKGLFLVFLLIRYNGTQSDQGYRIFPTCVPITGVMLDVYNGSPVPNETQEELETRFPKQPTLLQASK